MSKRSILILGIVALILIGFSLGIAQKSQMTPKRQVTPIPADKIVSITPPIVTGGKDYCFLAHTNWNPLRYFGSWNVGDKVAIYFDPTDCGYPQNYPFQLTDVEFYLYNFAGAGACSVRFSVEVVCPDICDGPGIEIYKSPIYIITTFFPDPVTIYFPVGDTICLDKPFFFNLEYMSGIVGSIPSVLFDDQEDMVDICSQWYWYDGFSPPWLDHYDFWAPPTAGWIVLGISGRCGDEQTNCGEWYWKPDTLPQAPSGMPDFDQYQFGPPDSVGMCGPTAVANCLWWFDAVPSGMNPPDLIRLLSDYFKTDPDSGTDVDSIQVGLDRYFENYGFPFKETTFGAPNFYEMEESLKVCQDIILLLGFYWWEDISQEWMRHGGHFVTMAGVNSEKKEIAISDPARDQCVQYPWWPGRVRPPDHPSWGYYGDTLHNDPTYVSHDIYVSLLNPEDPTPGNEWWELADYCFEPDKYFNINVPERFRAITKRAPKDAEYYRTEVEAAIVICPGCAPNDLGICDTLYIETFDCDHEYEAAPGSFDSVRVALYVTHDSNTFWWADSNKWVQDSIRAFDIPLTFWHQPPGCADSVILPTWNWWNNTTCNPFDPRMSRSIFRDIVDDHTGDTVYNRMFWLASQLQGWEWSTITLNIESHSSDGDSGYAWLNMIASGATNREWWEGSRVLLATLSFHVYMSEDCDTTEIGIDSTLSPEITRLAFYRHDGAGYVPRHFLPVKDTIYIPEPENHPPQIIQPDSLEGYTGATVTYTFDGIDPDGDVILDSASLEIVPDCGTYSVRRISGSGTSQGTWEVFWTTQGCEDSVTYLVIVDLTDTLGATAYCTTYIHLSSECDPNDLGICDTLYVETFDCDHEYEAEPGSFDSVRVAIYVTHDSNTFYWQEQGMWVQDSIAAFVIPLTFWHQPPGCADSVILPNWDNWNNTAMHPADPRISRSMFRHIVDSHTGDTVYNRLLQTVEAGRDPWNVVLDIEPHSCDGDSGHMFLSLIAMEHCQQWWEGSRELLATLTFHVYMSENCDTTEIGIDSTIWPLPSPFGLTFVRYDAVFYTPRHFLPVKDTIYIIPYISGDVNGDSTVDVGDVIYLINYLFTGASAPDPLCIGDVNCDTLVDVGDVIYLINYLFTGTSPPCSDPCDLKAKTEEFPGHKMERVIPQRRPVPEKLRKTPGGLKRTE